MLLKTKVIASIVKAKYIRVVAANYGKLPDWHNDAEGDAWIFAYEFIVG